MMIVGIIAGIVIIILGFILLVAGIIKLQSTEAVISGFILMGFGMTILVTSLPVNTRLIQFLNF